MCINKNDTAKEEFSKLAKQFCEMLDNATEEKRKELIEGVPDEKLKSELKKIYNIN